MARNSGAGATGGIWIFIAIIVYVIVEWGKIILISLAAIAGLFVLYFLGRQIYIRYKWRDNFKVLPKNGLREEITAKALKSKVFMSIQTDNRDELINELIDDIYDQAIKMAYFVHTPAIYDEKLNYMVHAAASKIKKKNNKTKK